MANGQGFFGGLFDDPERLRGLSAFLLNFGQGITQANQAGLSPFASVAAGFGAGGQGVQALRGRQAEEELEKLRRQKLEADVRKSQRQEAQEKRVADFTSATQGPVQFNQSRLGALAGTRATEQAVLAEAARLGLPPEDPRVKAIAGQFPERSKPSVKNFRPFYRPKPGGGFEIKGARGGSERAQQFVDEGFVPGTPPRGTALSVDDEGNVTFLEGPGAAEGVAGRTQARERVKIVNELTEQKATTLQLISRAQRLAQQVREGGAGVISVSAFASRLGESVREQAISLSEKGGFDLGDLGRFDFSAFGSDAVKSAKLRSNVAALAYMVARSQNQRVTDADFQNAINQIGGGTGDPESFIATLNEVVQNAISDTDISFRTRLGQPSNITSDLEALGVDPDIAVPPESFTPAVQGQAGDLKAMSAEELIGLVESTDDVDLLDRVLAEIERRRKK